MEITDSYLNFKPTNKYYYMKNNDIDKAVDNEELFTRILKDTDLVLGTLKISPSKLGYNYWRDAVLISIMCEKDHISVCKDIYPIIAKKYNKSIISIERAMRLCFEDVLYRNVKFEENYVFKSLEYFLINPQNSKLLCKIVEVVISSEFKKFRYDKLK